MAGPFLFREKNLFCYGTKTRKEEDHGRNGN